MNVPSEFPAQWEGFRRSFEAGRLAHAYVIVGPPRGTASAFANAVTRLLLNVPGDDHPMAHRLEQRAHPDVVWVEPQSKSRIISVNEMRALNRRIQQTSSESDWKIGVILYADRLNENAANAFLKTLEEPAGQTLLLLLTDAPEMLLPTIRSRCQQIVLPGHDTDLREEWREKTLDLLRTFGGRDPLQVFVASDALRALLDEIKKAIEAEQEQGEDEEDEVFNARVKSFVLEQRAQIMKRVLHWQRDLLYRALGTDTPRLFHFPEEQETQCKQAQTISCAAALRRIDAVEEMARRLDRNVPPTPAFDVGFAQQLTRRSSPQRK